MCGSNIARFLLKTRQARKLKQRDLSEMTGISQTKISQYERGKQIPDMKTIKKLLIALKIEIVFVMDKESEIV